MSGSSDLQGILGAVLGESSDAQKQRIEAAIQSANDLSGLVKRKRKAEDGAGAADGSAGENGKRARTEDAQGP